MFWVVRHHEDTDMRCLLITELNEDETQAVRQHIYNKENKGEEVGSSLLEPVRRNLKKRSSYLTAMGPQVGLQARRFRIPRRGDENKFINRIDACIKEILN